MGVRAPAPGLPAVALTFLLAGCSGGDEIAATPGNEGIRDVGDRTVPVLVDYSPTMSDVGALLYLATHPAVDLVAITLPGTGESPCEEGISNTAALLERIGHEQVPIACGPATPVGAGEEWPEEWQTAAAELEPLELPVTDVPTHGGGAVALIDDAAAENEDLVVVALAPLTNLALAVEEHPEVTDDIAMVFAMGGAISVAGNAPNGVSEWNDAIDPAAVDRVLRSGLPLTVVPLDATNDVPAGKGWWLRLQELAAEPDRPAARIVDDLWTAIRPWELGFFLWDELTAVVAIEPDLAGTTTERLSVVTDGPDAGRTVVDPDGTAVRVVVHPDRLGVEDELLDRLTAVLGEYSTSAGHTP